MSWIKLDSITPDKPEVRRAARVLGVDRYALLGRLVSLWCWADGQTLDGNLRLPPEDVDDMFSLPGLTDALIAAGWLELNDAGEVCVSNWDAHNGASAKRRAQEARRTAARKLRAAHAESVSESGQNDEFAHAPLTQESENAHASYTQKTANAHAPLTQKSAIAHAPLTLRSRSERDLDIDIIKENMQAVGSTTVLSRGAPPEQRPPQSPEFRRWVAAVAQAHPSAKLFRVLPRDAEAAAAAAWEAYPAAEEHAELLAAYMASPIPMDRMGRRFYRPPSLRKYFEALGDIMAHALNWDRETGWSRKRKRKAAATAAQRESEPEPEAKPDTPEEKAAFAAALRKAAGMEDAPEPAAAAAS